MVAMSGYYNVISYNSINNNFIGIILIVYETFCISIALIIKNNFRHFKHKKIDNKLANKRMSYLMFGLLLITIVVCYFAPEILKNYRLITGIFTDKDFTNI